MAAVSLHQEVKRAQWTTLLALSAYYSHGAYGRWRRGEPLRLSELLAVNRKTECERLERRKVELRQQHDRNSHFILDAAFRREFESLGIAADIYREVTASSGHHCAACSREFSLRRRKPLLHVDHIRLRKLYPHLLYVRSNLQVLCRSCNSHKSAFGGDDWRDIVATRRRATNRKRRAARYRS